MPTTEIPASEIPKEGMIAADILFAVSWQRAGARRLVEQGGITIDGNKINDVYCMTDCTNLRKVLRLKRKESVP